MAKTKTNLRLSRMKQKASNTTNPIDPTFLTVKEFKTYYDPLVNPYESDLAGIKDGQISSKALKMISDMSLEDKIKFVTDLRQFLADDPIFTRKLSLGKGFDENQLTALREIVRKDLLHYVSRSFLPVLKHKL